MKLKILIGELADLCTQTKHTLDRQSHLPTGHMYLRAKKDGEAGWLYAYSNNLVSAETLVKVSAEVEEEGEALVHPSRVGDFLMGRSREDQVTLSSDGKRMRLQYKRSRADLAVHPETEMVAGLLKRMPSKQNAAFTLQGGDLAEFVRRGTFCIPSDDNGQSGQVIGGMFFTSSEEGYEAQATDGFIAAQIKVKAEKGSTIENFMIPLDSLRPLETLVAKRRAEEVSLVPGPKGHHGMSSIYFRTGDVMFGTRLLHGQFPGLKQVIDSVKPDTFFRVKREELKAALGRCSAFAGRVRAVRMELKNDVLDMAISGDHEELQDSVTATMEKDLDKPVKIAVGLDYLINIASGSHAEDLQIGVSGPLKHILINDDSDGHVSSKYVLMPVKL